MGSQKNCRILRLSTSIFAETSATARVDRRQPGEELCDPVAAPDDLRGAGPARQQFEREADGVYREIYRFKDGNDSKSEGAAQIFDASARWISLTR